MAHCIDNARSWGAAWMSLRICWSSGQGQLSIAGPEFHPAPGLRPLTVYNIADSLVFGNTGYLDQVAIGCTGLQRKVSFVNPYTLGAWQTL